MEEAFKIPWVDPRDITYVRKGMYKTVIYAWRHFHYDIYIMLSSPNG